MFQDVPNELYVLSFQNDMLCLAWKMDIIQRQLNKRPVTTARNLGFPSRHPTIFKVIFSEE